MVNCGLKKRDFTFNIQLLTGQRLSFGPEDGLQLKMRASQLLNLVYRHVTVSRKHLSERQFLGLKFANPFLDKDLSEGNCKRKNLSDNLNYMNQRLYSIYKLWGGEIENENHHFLLFLSN